MSKIEEAVAQRILKRSKIGEEKYGTTMERNDLSLMQWLQHLQEELLDAAVYVEKLKQEVQYQEFELAEKRMDIIGRNGNDGLHYDEANYMYDKVPPCSGHAVQMDRDEDGWHLNTHPFQD